MKFIRDRFPSPFPGLWLSDWRASLLLAHPPPPHTIRRGEDVGSTILGLLQPARFGSQLRRLLFGVLIRNISTCPPGLS